MKAVWPEVPLSDVLREVSRPERPAPDHEYRLLGMRWYAGGLFEKERKKGRAIKAGHLYRVEEGDLVYNRLFAWKGSFGIVGPDVTGAYVSNEFPCFTVNKDLVSPEFLKWFVSRATFWEAVKTLSTGASRQSRLRLKQERFLSLCMPLPPVPEQRRIAAKIGEIATRADEARRLLRGIEDDQTSLLLRRVEELSRAAPRAPMAEVAPVVRRPVDVQPSEWYPELGIRSFGKGTFHKEAIKGSELGSKRIYRIEPGDLLFSNVFSWEGGIAVVQSEDKGRFGSHRFITCVPDPDRATAEFLCYYFLTDEGLADIRAASPGAAGRNKTLGVKKLEEIEVPLPPLEKQQEFGELLRRLRMASNIHGQTAASLDHFMPAVLDHAFRGEL
jgi:type I restriction enzyme S subunit